MKRSIYIILIFLFVAIALASGALWYVTHSTNIAQTKPSISYQQYLEMHGEKTELPEVDANDWKTFTSDIYGFSFKYPENWEIKRTSLYDMPFNLEDEKPNGWDSTYKGKFTERRFLTINMQEKDESENEVKQELQFVARSQTWGDLSAEDIEVNHLLNESDSGKTESSTRKYYVNTNGVYIEVEGSNRYRLHNDKGMEIVIFPGTVTFVEDELVFQNSSDANKENILGLISTINRL